MAEVLILDGTDLEGLCGAPYVRKRGSRAGYCCSRPKGHQGCHWTAAGRIAERFLVWNDAGVTVLRSVLPRMRLLGTQR